MFHLQMCPGDFRFWESPQTFSALFIGPFELANRFRNSEFPLRRITTIQSAVLSFSEDTAPIHRAFRDKVY